MTGGVARSTRRAERTCARRKHTAGALRAGHLHVKASQKEQGAKGAAAAQGEETDWGGRGPHRAEWARDLRRAGGADAGARAAGVGTLPGEDGREEGVAPARGARALETTWQEPGNKLRPRAARVRGLWSASFSRRASPTARGTRARAVACRRSGRASGRAQAAGEFGGVQRGTRGRLPALCDGACGGVCPKTRQSGMFQPATAAWEHARFFAQAYDLRFYKTGFSLGVVSSKKHANWRLLGHSLPRAFGKLRTCLRPRGLTLRL